MEVIQITDSNCKKWIIEKHYAGRMPTISYAFGVMVDNHLQGICTYGNTIGRFNCFEKQPYELNRLITNDDVPDNTLSQLVSKSLKMFPESSPIVSYADASQGHHGYIYQATNWLYTGVSSQENKYYVNGEETHRRTLYSRYGTSSIPKLEEMGLDVEVEEQLPKHRYFQVTGNKGERRRLRKKIKENFDILPYPKGENKNYDSGDPLKQRLFF